MRGSRNTFLIAAAAIGLAACAHSPTAVRETVLDNGLKVVVQPDHRAPVVVSQIWYKVGGSYEPAGNTGISHVLEHMMFKGTERYGPGQFSRIIAENGGKENAFTGRDYTAYFQRLEKSRLALSFELEADRMRNLRFDDEEFRKERDVVMEERRLRIEDSPESLTNERLWQTAYVEHPYRNPIIGWKKDLESLTVENTREWYRRWYSPENATLVVVGDVRPDEVFALARRYYGPVPRGEAPRPPRIVEPPQTSTRRVAVKAPAEVPYLILAYHVPVLAAAPQSSEPYALDVLASLLGGGDSARLPRELVRAQRVAADVGVGYDLTARSPTLFMIEANPAQGRSVEELERALREQVAALQEAPVTAQELDRVKAQVVAQDVYARDSMFYQAMRMGILETVGLDWRLVDHYVENIRAVTGAQVQAVARKYLRPENMTVAQLVPQPIGEAPAPRTPGGPADDVR